MITAIQLKKLNVWEDDEDNQIGLNRQTFRLAAMLAMHRPLNEVEYPPLPDVSGQRKVDVHALAIQPSRGELARRTEDAERRVEIAERRVEELQEEKEIAEKRVQKLQEEKEIAEKRIEELEAELKIAAAKVRYSLWICNTIIFPLFLYPLEAKGSLA